MTQNFPKLTTMTEVRKNSTETTTFSKLFARKMSKLKISAKANTPKRRFCSQKSATRKSRFPPKWKFRFCGASKICLSVTGPLASQPAVAVSFIHYIIIIIITVMAWLQNIPFISPNTSKVLCLRYNVMVNSRTILSTIWHSNASTILIKRDENVLKKPSHWQLLGHNSFSIPRDTCILAGQLQVDCSLLCCAV